MFIFKSLPFSSLRDSLRWSFRLQGHFYILFCFLFPTVTVCGQLIRILFFDHGIPGKKHVSNIGLIKHHADQVGSLKPITKADMPVWSGDSARLRFKYPDFMAEIFEFLRARSLLENQKWLLAQIYYDISNSLTRQQFSLFQLIKCNVNIWSELASFGSKLAKLSLLEFN